MTVYVVNKGYDYEGEDTLGVFASESRAWQFVEKQMTDDGLRFDLDNKVDDSMNAGMGTYYVRAMEVQS